MPAILPTAQVPRRNRENPDSERFAAYAGTPTEAQPWLPGTTVSSFESCIRGDSNSYRPKHIPRFYLQPLPRRAGEGYSYHNIFSTPIRLQDSNRLLATCIV